MNFFKSNKTTNEWLNEDNSYGNGMYKPTLNISNYLSSYKIPEFSYDANQQIQMFTFPVNYTFGITVADMKSLIRLGFTKMQSNNKTSISLYFNKEAEKIK